MDAFFGRDLHLPKQAQACQRRCEIFITAEYDKRKHHIRPYLNDNCGSNEQKTTNVSNNANNTTVRRRAIESGRNLAKN